MPGLVSARAPVPLLVPQRLAGSLVAAALAWSAAFGLCLLVFVPWLPSALLDGQDG
jgi:uncharacterized protein involved in response to NO